MYILPQRIENIKKKRLKKDAIKTAKGIKL